MCLLSRMISLVSWIWSCPSNFKVICTDFREGPFAKQARTTWLSSCGASHLETKGNRSSGVTGSGRQTGVVRLGALEVQGGGGGGSGVARSSSCPSNPVTGASPTVEPVLPRPQFKVHPGDGPGAMSPPPRPPNAGPRPTCRRPGTPMPAEGPRGWTSVCFPEEWAGSDAALPSAWPQGLCYLGSRPMSALSSQKAFNHALGWGAGRPAVLWAHGLSLMDTGSRGGRSLNEAP